MGPLLNVRGVAVRLRSRRGSGGTVPAGVCRAPFASMYLDQHGSVRACCQNSQHPLGNITDRRLQDIWAGTQAEALRDAMLAHDLELGCGFCKWQESEGNEGLVFARTFDHLQVDSLRPQWPKQLELSLSNACNLQCAMCNGDWSSAIRANREGRPPLPVVYDDQFFEDLEPFLRHAEVIKILGGEPFLGRESLRVMEMLAEMDVTPEVHVTTNGTQWSPRIERILERLPMTIVVSLDGIDDEVYESIRIGASLAEVKRNIDRFCAYTEVHGTSVNLAHCLMTSNWHRFADFLRFAEERRLRAYVNTVTHPVSLSMFHLPRRRLAAVVEAYRAEDARLSGELRLNRALWKDQLGRLERRLEGLGAQDGVDYYLGVHGFGLVDAEAPRCAARLAAQEAARDGDVVVEVRSDLDLLVVAVDGGASTPEADGLEDLVGHQVTTLQPFLASRFGDPEVFVPATSPPDLLSFVLEYADADAPRIMAFFGPVRDEDGTLESFVHALVIQGRSVATDGDRQEATAELLAAFRRAHPGLHELEVDDQGVVQTAVLGDDDLAAVVEGVVGLSTDELLDALSRELGALSGMQEEAHPLTTAMTFRVTFVDAAGHERPLEALHLPDGAASRAARLLLAAGAAPGGGR